VVGIVQAALQITIHEQPVTSHDPDTDNTERQHDGKDVGRRVTTTAAKWDSTHHTQTY